MDEIVIHALKVETHIGVPDEERTEPQTLLINLVLTPANTFECLEDDIARTVDYDAVARRVAVWAAERPRRLIETLADEIACRLLADFAVRRAVIEIRKFILPQTEYVAVRCTRERVE